MTTEWTLPFNVEKRKIRPKEKTGLDCRVSDRALVYSLVLAHHIDREMPPLVELTPQPPLVDLAFGILAGDGQLVVDVHLVPAHLVDCHHRALGPEPVELTPEMAFLFLNRRCGDLCGLSGQPSYDIAISIARHKCTLSSVCADAQSFISHS